MYRIAFILLIWTAFNSCQENSPMDVSVSGESILKHLEELSSDTYEGRMPCSNGENLTVSYLENELKALGLKPGNGTSYRQEVPLLTIDSKMQGPMTVKSPKGTAEWQMLEDYVIHSERKTDELALEDSELVFCGYGIVDEKLNWNDFEGVDLKGKTAVVLVNDPGFGGEDPDFFKGDIMTYYGRWTYKYDEADRQGADGLLIIHETSSAGYGWFVIKSSWTGPQQGLSGIDRSEDCGVKGWISLQRAQELFTNAGFDFTEHIKKARTPEFKPFSLETTVSAAIENSYTECISQNVIGYIEGSKYPEEYIIYTAHWDHIGIGQPVDGDSIYNGALDNASGTSTLLSIAEAYKTADKAPERSVVFLFVTAEEQGLLGSEYYVENPIFPLEQTVCNINIDGVNPAGPMKDFTITGKGHSEMDEVAALIAEREERYIMQEQEPEKGYFFRSDHFNFAKKGVPALYGEGGFEHKTKGKEYAKEFKDNYILERYHAPADEYSPESWDVNGMIQDGNFYFRVGAHLASSRKWPKWYPESEFKRPKNNLKD